MLVILLCFAIPAIILTIFFSFYKGFEGDNDRCGIALFLTFICAAAIAAIIAGCIAVNWFNLWYEAIAVIGGVSIPIIGYVIYDYKTSRRKQKPLEKALPSTNAGYLNSAGSYINDIPIKRSIDEIIAE